MLSRRSLTRGELRAKLLQRGYKSDEIEPLLDHYVDLGFLNDGVLALDYAKYALEARPMSKRMLIYDMKKRFFPQEFIETAVETAFEGTDDRAMAQKVFSIESKRTKDVKKIYAKLLRMGFPYDIIDEITSERKR